MAMLLHIERTYLYKILSGKRKPSLQILKRVKEITMDQVQTFKDLTKDKNEEREEEASGTT